MSVGQALTLLVAAVVVFWMLGAYNRLVRLRSEVGAAWQQFDAQLQRRALLTPALSSRVDLAMPAERPTLLALVESQLRLGLSADALRAAPVQPAAAAAVAAALAKVEPLLARLLALLEQPPLFQADEALAATLQELREIELRLAFARQRFNEAAEVYNEAAREFPTRLLLRLYRFGPAGCL